MANNSLGYNKDNMKYLGDSMAYLPKNLQHFTLCLKNNRLYENNI